MPEPMRSERARRPIGSTMSVKSRRLRTGPSQSTQSSQPARSDNSATEGRSPVSLILIPAIFSLIAAIVGGAIGSAATVYVQRAQFAQQREDRAQELRTQAYRKFLDKSDAAFNLGHDYSRCLTMNPLGDQVKTETIECEREGKRLLDAVTTASGTMGEVVIYGSEQANEVGNRLVRKLLLPSFEPIRRAWVYTGPDYETFLDKNFPTYIDERGRFLLVMCHDLAPIRRQSCEQGP